MIVMAMMFRRPFGSTRWRVDDDDDDDDGDDDAGEEVFGARLAQLAGCDMMCYDMM